MIKTVLNNLKRLDLTLLSCVFVLVGFSTYFLYGAGQHLGGDIASFWQKQLVWFILGSVLMLIIAAVDFEIWSEYSGLLYLGVLLLLLAVLVPGIGKEVNGARSWIPILGTSSTIQPAEFAKPVALLFTAWLMSKADLSNPKGIVPFILPAVAMGIPVLFIMMQPDAGTAMVFIPMLLAIVFVAGLAKRWMFLAVIAAIILAVPLYQFVLTPYQQGKIITLFNPTHDLIGSGWGAYQSRLAVASGGLTGKGFGHGIMYILGFVPKAVATTDYIHSVIAEETGFVGCSVLISLYIIIILRAVKIAAKSAGACGKFVASGFIGFLLMHCYVNIGMTIGVAPIIGLPLPFFSYGGSFMVTCMIFIGLLQSIHVHRHSTQ
ncbi:MAG: rod shape-determining protein RodA [Lentisphaeria bacterium]|nr:rod shape-determining protein RodA [Lentisphaeria bacterium]